MVKLAGYGSILELCGVFPSGRGLCFNTEAPALLFDSETTREGKPNYLEYDDRVGTWYEAGYDVAYNDFSYDGAL